MSELKQACEALGFSPRADLSRQRQRRFRSRKSEAAIKRRSKSGLRLSAASLVGVLVRSAEEMARVASDNPFRKAAANRTMAIFRRATGGHAL
jgi:uncharacterized protein (DUF1697 family)